MKIVIKNMNSKEINTKNGPATQIGVQGEDGTWYSAFANDITDTWAIGQEIDVDVEVNGKYKNIVFKNAPKQVNPQNKIIAMLERIERKLDAVLHSQNVPEGFNDASPPSDEALPF